jgi:hypothetical protein
VYFTILHYLVIDWSLFADDDVLPESVSAERVAQGTMAAGLDSEETRVSSVVAGNRLVAWVAVPLCYARLFARFAYTHYLASQFQRCLLGGVT